MRRQLIEALTYPGILVRQLIEGGNYPHKSFFDATGERCHTCDGSGDNQQAVYGIKQKCHNILFSIIFWSFFACKKDYRGAILPKIWE